MNFKILATVFLLAAFAFQTVLSQEDFALSNYKYMMIEAGSRLTLSHEDGTSHDISPDILSPFIGEVEHFNPEKEHKRRPACLLFNDEDWPYFNKFEQAICFVKVRLDPGGQASAFFYDAKSGWKEPAGIIQESSSSLSGYKEASWKSALANLAVWLASNAGNFDEAGSNAYFYDVEETAKQFYDSNQNLQEEEEIDEFDDVMFQTILNPTSIKSVFILNGESENCAGSTKGSQGLSQLASLKLMGAYNILDRSNLETIIDEQKLGASGMTDESTLLELGRLQGSEGVIFCQEACVSETTIQTIKLLNCVTGEQEWVASTFDGDAFRLCDAVLFHLTH